MNAIRYKNSNTTANMAALTGMIEDENAKKVILFASPTVATEEFARSDGPETNLPLLSALVEYEIPRIETLHVVFDGIFLTAARYPRYSEVRHLLDVAEKSQKVFFSERRAPFTSSLAPADAAQELCKLELVSSLNQESRANYFSLISNLTEDKYRALYA